MKKIKLFSMLALLLMAVSTNAKITWDNTNVFVEANQFAEVSSWEPAPRTFEGVTISLSGTSYSRFIPYDVQTSAAVLECFGEDGDSFTFTAPSGKQFVKIEINGNSPFPFTEYGDWTQPELNQILWSGTAASTVTLGGSDDTYAHDLSSIVFYFEEDIQEPYTFYFHPGSWADRYGKYAIQSWSTDYEASVYSEFMTPVAGHEGWFSTSVPDGNNNMFVCAYSSEATTPTEGVVDYSYQLSDAGTYTYYYFNVGWVEDFDGRLTDGRIVSGNIIYSVNDENNTAEVYGDQSPVAPTGELIIPSSITCKKTYTVTSIAGSAYWYGSGITSVSLPNTLLHIGDAAFIGTGLTSVTIPSSVTSIEDGAFALCGALSSVTLEEGLTALGTQMFQGASSLTQITFPNSITELPGGILSNCEGLVSVTLGTGVDTIGDNAFDGSNSLARLTIYAPAPPKVNLEDNPELVSTCILMVPSAAKAAYQAHPYWSQFTIKGIYIVTFLDKDGNTIKTEAVEEGQSATAPDAPEVGCYTFNRWDVDFSNVHSDLEVNALYTQNVYTVTFLNEGVQHNQQQLFCGEDATKPADPTKEGHHFTGWDAEFTNVQSNLTINATFEINTYTVTFKDSEGNTIGEPQVVDWNTAAEAPVAPEVTCNHFTGWDKAFDHVQADLTVTALYAINQYEVKFLDWDGAELKKQTVDCGGDAEAPANPSRDGHTFTGWDIAFTNVTANLVVNAQFAINTYDVVFKDYDGSVLKEAQKVNWHEAAIAPADPTREGYAFTGWDKDFSNIEADLVVTATYEILTFKVVFKDYDGTILKAEQIVNWNEAAIAPEETPHRNYYTFTGWDKAFEHVTSDLVITAQYEPGEEADIRVSFADPTETEPELAHTDVVIRIPAAPEIEGFIFKCWQPVAEPIEGTIRIQAIYIPNDPSNAPAVYTNPANPAQKLIKNGNVYILTDDKTYSITGQIVESRK